MKDIRFKTYPRLFNPIMLLSGTAFMAALAKLMYPTVLSIIQKTRMQPMDYVVAGLFLFFSAFSIICVYYFLTTKTIWLSRDKFIINYFFLPFKKAFDLKDIASLAQTTKKAYHTTNTYKNIYVFTERTTLIKVNKGKEYKINSLVQSEYDLLLANLRKLKDGQISFKPTKNRLINYLFDNLDGIIWMIFCLAGTILLNYHIYTK